MPKIITYNKRLEALRTERSSFMPTWEELSRFHLGHSGRFLSTEKSKGFRKNTSQFNNTSRLAVRTITAGMSVGITSQAQPWFKLAAPDPEMNEYSPVKEWLHTVQTTMYKIFAKSNFYNAINHVYSELAVFGVAPMGIYQDFENVIWCKPETIGSYMLAANGRNIVDTRYREYDYTVGETVKEFGFDNCSNSVQNMWKNGNTETTITIVHVIEPNDDRDENKPLAKFKKFRSVYYEKGIANNEKFLRESGFDSFPLAVPRWDVIGEDVYATDCPGMTALGDTKGLQLGEKRYYQAVDKLVSPALIGSVDLKNSIGKGGLRPDSIHYSANPAQALVSAYGNYRPEIGVIMDTQAITAKRIKDAFYEDLFRMIIDSDRRQITAHEVAEKKEEKLLLLGPALGRFHTEGLDVIIDRTFEIAQKAGIFPPPPEELADSELKVEYVSILAQAQRMVSSGGIEKVINFAAQMGQIWPEALEKIDPLQVMDEYSTSIGINPRIIRGDDEVNQRINDKQQAMAAQQQQMQTQEVANMGKTLSETDTGGDNALTAMMQNMGVM